jgi:hypothetical protein
MTASQFIGICLIGGYWLTLLFTRWMFIARPNRRFTLARIDDAQYHLEPANEAGPTLLDEARSIATGDYMLGDPDWLRRRRGVADREPEVSRRIRVIAERVSAPVAWNGSRDLVAWDLVHRVEAEAAGKLTGPDLMARLMKAQSQLDDLPERKRVYWSHVLHDVLEGCPAGGLKDEAIARAILYNLLTELYDSRDTKFTNLATQQNKVTWLVFIGLAIMAALVSKGYEDLLLAGAVGGILSRLQRELGRRDVPSDYGLSWSVLFLSPVSGALSAWAGLLLLQALQTLHVIDLAGLLPDGADLTHPVGSVLGVAIVFGFSERLLDRIVRQATEEIAVKPADDPAKVAPAPLPEPPTTSRVPAV